MAITDIKEYAHLTPEDVDSLARELDAIRTDIEESRGERDARYIRRAIQLQRALAVGGRAVLFASRNKVAWGVGTAMLGTAKIIENMELGHNIIHGQWDWMNDPEIHSTEWEWDTTSPSEHWKKSHNFIHHKYTNVVGLDDDIGYGIMRLTRDQRWEKWMIFNPVIQPDARDAVRVGSRAHGLETTKFRKGEKSKGEVLKDLKIIGKKVGKQVGKDYIVFPALGGTQLEAHDGRQCGRQPDPQLLVVHGDLLRALPGRRGEVHQGRVRQRDPGRVVSAADAGIGQLSRRPADGVHERQPLLPDRTPPVPGPAEQPLCRNQRAGPGAVRQVRPAIHDGIAGSPVHAVVLTIAKLALPNKLLKATSDNAPETNSELKFRIRDGVRESFGIDPATGKRRGLRTAIREVKTGAIAAS